MYINAETDLKCEDVVKNMELQKSRTFAKYLAPLLCDPLMKRLIQYKRPNMQQLAPCCSRYCGVYLSKKSRFYKYISIYVYTYLYKHIF